MKKEAKLNFRILLVTTIIISFIFYYTACKENNRDSGTTELKSSTRETITKTITISSDVPSELNNPSDSMEAAEFAWKEFFALNWLTPGVAPNSWLTLETPLNPFKKTVNGIERSYTSVDCINIETQLGITYGQGSLDDLADAALLQKEEDTQGKMIKVTGINKAIIPGSFLISSYINIDGEDKIFLCAEAVLGCWNVQHCANCQTHLM